jgi:hypothetical protein
MAAKSESYGEHPVVAITPPREPVAMPIEAYGSSTSATQIRNPRLIAYPYISCTRYNLNMFLSLLSKVLTRKTSKSSFNVPNLKHRQNLISLEALVSSSLLYVSDHVRAF